MYFPSLVSEMSSGKVAVSDFVVKMPLFTAQFSVPEIMGLWTEQAHPMHQHSAL